MPPCFMRCVVDANILLKVSDEIDNFWRRRKKIIDSFVFVFFCSSFSTRWMRWSTGWTQPYLVSTWPLTVLNSAGTAQMSRLFKRKWKYVYYTEREREREYVCLSVFTEILFSSSYIFISRTGYIIPRLCAIFFKIECVFSSFFLMKKCSPFK